MFRIVINEPHHLRVHILHKLQVQLGFDDQIYLELLKGHWIILFCLKENYVSLQSTCVVVHSLMSKKLRTPADLW